MVSDARAIREQTHLNSKLPDPAIGRASGTFRNYPSMYQTIDARDRVVGAVQKL